MDSTTLDRFKHIALQICYRSVYGDRWHLTDAHIGGQTQWHEATTCPSGAGSESRELVDASRRHESFLIWAVACHRVRRRLAPSASDAQNPSGC